MSQRIIEVVDYRPEWIEMFNREEQLITAQLDASNIVAIHHIGSTSVPHLCAKPIIDILLEVEDLSLLDNQTLQMQSIGYLAKGEFGIAGRRYFQKGGVQRTHQVHAFLSGSEDMFRHLAFRDYLRAFPHIAKEYGELKQQAAVNCQNDIERYCDYKNAFVKNHEARAIAWQRSK
ncbi:GrpB family protein [Celerinatantimonas yamalensis]|uniref:GrpB family protein n=1 Tax=Celerinatantimonas yamalensis TaxID=559956 RepID=A0ABW9GAP3_9GAMM